MNIFAWNITLKLSGDIPKDFDFDYLESNSNDWYKNLYIFWETELKTSNDLINYFEKKLWKIKNYDLSISSEDKINVLPYDFEEWIYEVTSFEWEHVDFNEISDRFAEHDALFSVREAEISDKFWNKVIKVDFVY